MISYFSLDTFRILPSSLIFNILIIMSLSMSTWVCIIETLQAPQTWISIQFSSVQFSCSVVSDPLQPHELQHARPPCPGGTPKLIYIESVMPSSHLIFCHPLLLLLPIPPSIRVFSSESTLYMRWPKYWNFSLSISPSNEHPELVSFRISFTPLQIEIVFNHYFFK